MKKNQITNVLGRRLGWCGILIFFHLGIFGQINSTLWFQSISPKIGFSQSYNYYVLHDSEGFIWISSIDGLNRFDGQRVKLYESRKGDSTTLFDETIYGNLYENNQKDIWFTSLNAIHQYHRQRDNFSHFFLKSNPADTIKKEYHSFGFEEDRYLWIKTESGIFKFDTHNLSDEFVCYTSYKNVSVGSRTSSQIQKIYAYGGGKDMKGMEVLSLQKGKNSENIERKFQEYYIQDVFYQNDTLVWISTYEKGIARWNPIDDTLIFLSKFSKDKCVIAKLDYENLIIGVENKGIFQYNIPEDILEPISMRVIGKKEDFSISIWNLFIDDKNNIWVSDRTNGIYFANPLKNKFHSIPKFSTSINSNYSFRKIIEADDGDIWCATENAGIIRYYPDLDTFDNYIQNPQNNNSLASNVVWDILEDKKNRIWVATYPGLALYQNGNQFRRIKDQNGISRNYFVSIVELQKRGDLLVASIDGGIFKVVEKENDYELVNILKPLTDEGCDLIFEDKEGNVIISSFNTIGVYKYKKGQLLLQRNIPINAYITGFWEDEHRENLWISTSNGLVRTSKKDNYTTPEFLEINDQLPGRYIKSMLSDNANSLWVGTNNGLAKVHLDSLSIQKFDLADGTQSIEFNIKAALKRKNGDLWFGGFDGITIISSHKINPVSVLPKLKVTNIKINDLPAADLICEKTKSTNVSQVKHISRPYNDNTISLEFVAMEYSDPTTTQLEYQLVGADKKPVSLKKGEYGFARYPNLEPKTYTFKLRGANSDGLWSDQTEILKITIQPPFYKTWWFYLICFTGSIGLIYFYYRFRVAQIKKEESFNTRIAENKMAALRSQMNPHFIYNSMQTVNGIISRKDNLGAVKYVNKFSKLMRMILENSRKGSISLDEEILFLKSYMDIENRRFQTPFKYTITVGEQVDTYDTLIPSMLTQPFVENAIKHGIFHKEKEGLISIQFFRENGSLKCVVEDNGVGREKSRELNTQSGRQHKSRGLEIVNERLDIIQKSHPGKYNVNIIDLVDLEQKPTGTRVEITLPFE